MVSPPTTIPTRALVPDDLRNRMVGAVMRRDGMTKEAASRVVNGLGPADLTRLEMETRDHERPAFTADYDPFARS